MRYMLVNVSPGNLQLNLYSPNPRYKDVNLNRPGPTVALSIGRGKSEDILPYFNGSVELAHAAVMHSTDTLRTLKPNQLHIFLCDDNGKLLDVDKLFGPSIDEQESEQELEVESVESEQELEVESVESEQELEVESVESEQELEVESVESEQELEVESEQELEVESEQELEVESVEIGRAHV